MKRSLIKFYFWGMRWLKAAELEVGWGWGYKKTPGRPGV